MPLLAVATPAAVARNSGPTGTPTTACCSSIVTSGSDEGIAALKSISVVLSDLNVPVGLTCSPITVIGVGSGSSCSGTTVNCSNGIDNGIGIGCAPVTL
ncbi:hypothetical protein EIP86_007735 [Pleurotus ostreatoroseus]|nr:hypothetical protein EIP86_007735 [Pleurotus ostreatoroseus]